MAAISGIALATFSPFGYGADQFWSSGITGNTFPVPTDVYNYTTRGTLFANPTVGPQTFNVVSVQSNSIPSLHKSTIEGPNHDWFERLHSVQATVDVGFILADTEDYILIHNAYRELQVTVSALTNNVSADSYINPGASDILAPLTTEIYTLTFDEDGDAELDGTFDFVFDTGETLSPRVVGIRMVVLPWVAQDGASETLEWRTDILPAYGQEQRRGLRDLPRRTISLDYLVQNSHRAILEEKLARQTLVFSVMYWWDARDGSAITAGDTSITVDTDSSEFKDGAFLLIYESYTNYEIREIDTVGSGTIALTLGTTNSYTLPVIVPAFGGYIQSARLQRQSNEINHAALDFQLINHYDYADPSTTQHRTYDVLTDPSIVVEPVELVVVQSSTWRDNGIAGAKPYARENRARFFDTQHWLKDTRAARATLKKWLYSRKGQRIPFFYPTWQSDLVLVNPIAAIDVTMTVEQVAIDAPFDIMLVLTDGAIYYRQIIGKTLLSGNHVLDFSPAFGIAIALADVDRISLMRLSRHATDSITIEYRLPHITRTAIPITEL